MRKPFTKINLSDVEDSAAKFGFDTHEARFANKDLGLEKGGLSLQKIKPGARFPFGHSHKVQEEIVIILSGSGKMKIDEEIVDLKPKDAIRIGLGTVRSAEAGKDGLEYIVFGAPKDAEKDWEMFEGWWGK